MKSIQHEPFDRITSTVLISRWKTTLLCPTCNQPLFKHPFDTSAMYKLYAFGKTALYPKHDTYLTYECEAGHLFVAGVDTSVEGLYAWKE